LVGAREAEERRLALAVELGEDDANAAALNNLANYLWVEGELEKALDLYRQAFGFTGTVSALFAAGNLSCALVDAGRLAEADQMIDFLREHGVDIRGSIQVSLARIRVEQGTLHEAADLLQASVDDVQSIGGAALCDCLRVTARLAGLTAQPEAAARLLGAADANDLNPAWPFTRGERERATPPAEHALGPERFHQLYREGQELPSEQAGSLARAVTANVLRGTPGAPDQHPGM
jgi:hypothetical protein